MLPRELAEAVPVRLPASEEVHGAVLPALEHLWGEDEDGELDPPARDLRAGPCPTLSPQLPAPWGRAWAPGWTLEPSRDSGAS